jgi:CMP-N-acetylneuraminic acid synthetase
VGEVVVIALIGARSGSKRIPNKNLRLLDDKPLLVHTLQAAFDAECFDRIVLSTDSEEIAKTALDWCGKLEIVMRPEHLAQDDSPDLDWIKHALHAQDFRYDQTRGLPEPDDEYCLLRPTSPFRGPETIQAAVSEWMSLRDRYDSLRAVREVSEHPGKMWVFNLNSEMKPMLDPGLGKRMHNEPTQSLPPVYVQTGGLEIAWTRTPLELNSISGSRVAGFIVEGAEALDINSPEDWVVAESYLVQPTPLGR